MLEEKGISPRSDSFCNRIKERKVDTGRWRQKGEVHLCFFEVVIEVICWSGETG